MLEGEPEPAIVAPFISHTYVCVVPAVCIVPAFSQNTSDLPFASKSPRGVRVVTL